MQLSIFLIIFVICDKNFIQIFKCSKFFVHNNFNYILSIKLYKVPAA